MSVKSKQHSLVYAYVNAASGAQIVNWKEAVEIMAQEAEGHSQVRGCHKYDHRKIITQI